MRNVVVVPRFGCHRILCATRAATRRARQHFMLASLELGAAYTHTQTHTHRQTHNKFHVLSLVVGLIKIKISLL